MLRKLEKKYHDLQLRRGQVPRSARGKAKLPLGSQQNLELDDVLTRDQLGPLPDYVEDTDEPVLERVDPQWIDIERIKTWLSICDNEHGNDCDASSSIIEQPDQGPEWLVDVKLGRLVPYEPEYRYVALSYVWGNVRCTKTLKDNLSIFLTDGALFKKDLNPPLPRTFWDVIRLTEILGERYLWVDALCIVQDIDDDSRAVYLNSMASVYKKAYFTIVAANGWDANHGLRGIKGLTDPRHCSSENQEEFWESLQPHSSIWYSRAWTLQELIFSRRIIMFHYQLAVWECRCSTWHEALHPRHLGYRKPQQYYDSKKLMSQHPNKFRVNESSTGSNISFWPNLKQYMDIVHSYSLRKLSFPEDIHAAFSGITSTLTQSFSGGFIYGLPEMFFDVVLLWQPLHYSTRRDLQHPGHAGNKFPSWSWMGWTGEVDPRSWESGYDYMRTVDGIGIAYPTFKTTSTIRWFSCDETGENRRLIETTYKNLSHCKETPNASLPAGWLQWSDQSPPRNRQPDLIFTHEAIGFSAGTLFNYPIPIAPPSITPDSGQRHSFLQCNTRRAYLNSKLFVVERVIGGILSTLQQILLRDDEDKVIGMLRLNVPNQLLYSYKGEHELIELSAGEMSENEGGPFTRSTYFGLHYTFYNVMAITWKDGIAYREAVGRVLKESWDKCATERIDVILG